MITTKRNGYGRSESYSKSNVAVLDRPASSYNEYVNPAPVENEENLDEARVRMQDNLNKLLNYDRYSEEVAPVETPAPVVAASTASNVDEDIKPTSTTMQFGDGDLDQMYKEMNVKSDVKESYRLNSKGKLAVVLYSLAVAVILALIILNTGLLANLKGETQVATAKLDELITMQASNQTVIDSYNDDYVSNWAIQNGMIK